MNRLMTVILLLAVLSACSSNVPNTNVNNELIKLSASDYANTIQKAKDLESEGKFDEALLTLEGIELTKEDLSMYFYLINETVANDMVSNTDPDSATEFIKSQFEIYNEESNVEGDYIYVTGSIKNIGENNQSYVKVKVTFFDEESNVLDTNWTYAVDSVGLEPNESRRFEIMTRHMKDIRGYKLEVIK